jgi:hypothetical protein
LIGGAIDDALGTTLEFERPGTLTPIPELIGGGPTAGQCEGTEPGKEGSARKDRPG